MANFDTTASQRKALTSLGIASDPHWSYETAKLALEAAGVAGNGQVAGVNPRQAKNISDAEYAAMLRKDAIALGYASEVAADYANN